MAFEKLITALQAFNKPQHQRFLLYLQSPYFNTPEAALQLYGYLARLHPLYPAGKLKTTAIAKKIPALHNKNKQAKAGTELLKMILQFIAQEEWQKNHHEQTVAQLQGLKNLHLFDWYKQIAEKTGLLQSEITHADIDTLYYRHRLTEINLNGFDARLQRNSGNNLYPVVQTLDLFYALKKLRYHCELLSRHQVLGTPYQADNINYLLQLLQPYCNPQHPYIFLFTHVYHMLSAADFTTANKHHTAIHQYITAHSQQPLSASIAETIGYLINFSLQYHNTGNQQAGQYALHWYQVKLQHGLFATNNKVLPADFRNLISLCVIYGTQPGWLKTFIDTHTPLLPEPHRHNHTAFAYGQYYYFTKQYNKALPYLQQAVAKKEPVFNMIILRWQFMCLYEQNSANTQLLYQFIEAWQRQLHRSTTELHQLKEIFLKVITYSKKLLAAQNKTELQLLLAQLNSEPFFAGKYWLAKQIENKISP